MSTEPVGTEPKNASPGSETHADRFERPEKTGRVGAHRINPRPRHVWQYLVSALVGFAILTTLGIFAAQRYGAPEDWQSQANGSSGETEKKDSENSEATAVLDPTATVAVLNGTETPNLASGVDQVISANQWGVMAFSGSAAAPDVQTSAVFYGDDADAEAASALAAQLGGMTAYKTDQYADYQVRLVVLLGADYGGPGFDEAAQITAADEGGLPAEPGE